MQVKSLGFKGLQILKSQVPPILIGGKKTQFKEYKKAIQILLKNKNAKPSQRFSSLTWRVAWITEDSANVHIEPALLEFEGISLDNVVFIESRNIAAAFQGVCEDSFFSAIVIESDATPACLAAARKWLKPPSSGHTILKASELENFISEKLVLFLS